MKSQKKQLSANEKIRIVVLGYLVRGPQGGMAWHHLQYIMGLQLMGHDVIFLEDSADYPSCYNPITNTMGTDPSYGLEFTANAFNKLNLGNSWAYYDSHTDSWEGPLAQGVKGLCKERELLLNLSGVNPLRPWLRQIPIRVLLDTDPVFMQLRHLQEPAAMDDASAHNFFFTFGENFGGKYCSIPNDGFDWKPTRQPVVLDAWKVTPGDEQGHFSTVMKWDSYQSRQHEGIKYGMKSVSFEPYLNLPQLTGEKLELAMGTRTSAPRSTLEKKGWLLRDPMEAAGDPWKYQEYLTQSKGEFGVAKHGYVISQSGWFSERSACYLACGRPVVLQNTGFSLNISDDAGLIPFCNLDEALEGLEAIGDDYKMHCEAARDIAVSHFDSQKVLSSLIERVM
jgi:hypothetical protein